ncbi:MAG: hypothetical protein WD078_07820 [Woeseia sp.]
MRSLTTKEVCAVAGATDQCMAEDFENNYGGITDSGVGGDPISSIYEDLVAVASHIIERVAEAL